MACPGPDAGAGDAASPWGQNPPSCTTTSSLLWARERCGLPPRRGPSRVRASSMSAASATVQWIASSESLRGRWSRCTSAPSRIPLPAAASRGRAPRRSWRNSCGERRGHIRSSASATSATRRSRWARSFCSSWLAGSSASSRPVLLRYSSESARSTCASTKRRRALWVPGRRRAAATMSSVTSARRRSTPAPKGISASRRSGRSRVRTARVRTWTIRTSPLSLAAAGSSTPCTRTSGTRPATVDRLTPVSPKEGSTCSM